MRRKKWTTEEELEIWAKGIKTFPPPKEGKKYGPSDAFKPLFINNWKNRLRYSTESTPKYYRSHHHRFSGDLLSGGAGSGKCLGKGTKVMLFNGTTKNVEDIQVGEYLMGPDSLPRRVESTCTGQEEMFLIKPSRKEGFVCNRSHILSLRDSDENIINISVDAFLKLPVKKQQSSTSNCNELSVLPGKPSGLHELQPASNSYGPGKQEQVCSEKPQSYRSL